MKQHEITIIGTGMVGLSLAKLLADQNFSVAIIESQHPSLHWPSEDLTARVSAIHTASKRLFDYINIWKKISPAAYAPLKTMQIWDYAGGQISFDSNDAHADQMGWIVENRAIVKALWESLQDQTNVTFYCPNYPKSLIIKNDIVTLTLNDDTQILTDLVVGADGANSWLRQQMPVTLSQRPYYHKAIIAVIASTQQHNNCAYQKFLETGPVALLPSAHSNQTSLVWSADPIKSDELFNLDNATFSQSLSNATDYRLGELKVISQRQQFPLIKRHASDYVAPHCALIGDAAHTIHPLAGLGANLGFMDAACLAQTLVDAKKCNKSIGALRTLRRYARWRKADNTITMTAMGVLKNMFGTDDHTTNFLRTGGVNLINQCQIAKKQIMRLAMGESEDLPDFLQS